MQNRKTAVIITAFGFDNLGMTSNPLKELGRTAEESVYVGDSEVDIETAKNAGMPCVSVLWGFRDREFLEEHGAKRYARTAEDVLKLVEQM